MIKHKFERGFLSSFQEGCQVHMNVIQCRDADLRFMFSPMDSPKDNRITFMSSPTSSSIIQESPFFDYLCNFSPIESFKIVRCTHRLLDADLPPQRPVFTLPHINLQQGTSFVERFAWHANRDEIVAASSDGYGCCDSMSDVGMIPRSEQDVQPCSPLRSVDEYLTDPVEVEDCTDYDGSLLIPDNVTPQALQSSFTGQKEIIKTKDGKNLETGLSASPRSSEQAEEDQTGNSVELAEIAGNQRNTEKFYEFLDVRSGNFNNIAESDMRNSASRGQHCKQIAAQIAGGQHDDELNSTFQSVPESLHVVEAYEDCDESSVPVPKGSDKETTQHQRETRRHLQFEAGNRQSSSNITNNTANSRLLTGLTKRSLVSSDIELRGTSSSQHPVSSGQTMISQYTLFPAKRSESHTEMLKYIPNRQYSVISAAMPSGIGLHLNSIGNTVSMGSGAVASMKSAGHLSLQEKSETHNLAKDSNSCSKLASVAGEFSSHGSDHLQEVRVAVAPSSGSTKPPNASLHSKLIEQQGTPHSQDKFVSESCERAIESNQMSPRNKRKRNTDEGVGCKRCNCKRSRCLKLYCECFAAGVYCADSCACENCFNKPEFEDTVLDTRQQIESRNPLAFAPKILNHGTASPANIRDDGNRTTPSSARHKRGCNCKKSKCLKRYCECYQAKVGCSDGCRCEGCQNAYGVKSEIIYRREVERRKDSSHDKLLLPRQSLSSPSVSTDQESDSSKGGRMDQFSPLWEGLTDINNLTPLSNPSSASTISRNCPKASQASHQSSPISFVPQLCVEKDNDTPEILKDASTPIKGVKVRSPNKKRVSPPHLQMQEVSSSSSSELTSGRKYILQSLSRFPSLSPVSNSKDGIVRMRSDPKDGSSDE